MAVEVSLVGPVGAAPGAAYGASSLPSTRIITARNERRKPSSASWRARVRSAEVATARTAALWQFAAARPGSFLVSSWYLSLRAKGAGVSALAAASFASDAPRPQGSCHEVRTAS